MRRECLDYLIPFSRSHLRRILAEWIAHYNRGRPHSSLGPAVPESNPETLIPSSNGRHVLSADARIHVKSVLGGLHHEYSLEKQAA